MRFYTDFIISVKGGKEIEFRHEAKSIRELWMLQDEMIFDYLGYQCIRKSEIKRIQLNPTPFSIGYILTFGKSPSNKTDLWGWVNSLTTSQRDEILDKYAPG